MRIHTTVDTKLSPDGVIAALTDFSERRPELWPNLDPAQYQVHEVGDGWADVTEGSARPKVFARERYDWSQPGRVAWKATESNFCTPGSGVVVNVTEGEAGGSHLEIDWERTPANMKGRVLIGMMGLVGKRMLSSSFQKTLDAIAEQASD